VSLVVNPGVEDQWKKALTFSSSESTLIFLNSISGGWTYELGGPIKEAEQVYYMKRVSKGCVFRCYPGVCVCVCVRARALSLSHTLSLSDTHTLSHTHRTLASPGGEAGWVSECASNVRQTSAFTRRQQGKHIHYIKRLLSSISTI